tara:strand:- start:471 stop:629 length:159 start_codon:yes stop_codon:yes gene_type:complete
MAKKKKKKKKEEEEEEVEERRMLMYKKIQFGSIHIVSFQLSGSRKLRKRTLV